MMKLIKRLVKEEDGQAMVEYGLLVALIAVVVIAALLVLGPNIHDMFDKASEKITV
jgi:pilus assembly protein Flp/PilA